MNSLIVVFTYRLNIGLTAIPYHVSFQENNLIELLEHVTKDHLKNQPRQYTDDEKKVVNLLHSISDKELLKKYSRESNIRDFKKNIPEKILNERIRPDIENKMYELVRLLAEKSSVPAYYKQGNFSNLYYSDALTIPSKPCEAIFRVDIDGGEMNYSLKFRQDETVFTFENQKPEIICSDPAVLKAGHTLLHFEKFDSAKLKPFSTKPFIHLKGEKVINTYMEKFITKVVEKFEIEGSGFKIINTSNTPKIRLSLEKNLALNPVLRFKFKYGNRIIEANQKRKVFVNLKKDKELFIFNRFCRDTEVENRVFDLLQKHGLKRIDETSYVHPDDIEQLTQNKNDVLGPENIVEWVQNHKTILDKYKIKPILKYNDTSFCNYPPKIHFETHKSAIDWFDITSIVEIPPFKIPFSRFKRNILDEDRFFKLPDGSIFLIPETWFSKYSDLFNFGKIEKDTILLPKAYYLLLDELMDEEGQNIEVPSQMLPNLNEFKKTSLPDGLEASLRPYQEEGYHWLLFLKQNQFGGILADDMGLGKTLQTIALLLKVYASTENKETNPEKRQLSLFSSPIAGLNKTGYPPTLIVMPTSLVHNWDKEIKRFAPSLKTYLYAGANRPRSKDIWKILRHYHVVITTYGTLRNDIEYLVPIKWEYLILDESQNIKNPASKSYEAVSSIKAHNILALTGTPIENSLTDLWAQMNIVNHGLLKTLSFFKRNYVTPITKNQNQEKTDHLQKIINPFLLRRTKEMVAKDLPPIMEQVVYCNMPNEQKNIYEKEQSNIRNHILETMEDYQKNKQSIIALQALTRLRQIANHPAMTDPDYSGTSGKFDQIMESLESIISEHHHILVFSSFVKDLELLETELNKRHIAYAKLIGSTTNREKVIEQFNEDDNVKVFLISLKAGGVGLNLTKADYVFMLNPWWNPAAESQAINRAHRIGQTRNVFVYRFISTDTIEEKIALLQEKKNEIAQAFVNTTNPLSQMSTEEIKELFS